jgi:hypothetical protein
MGLYMGPFVYVRLERARHKAYFWDRADRATRYPSRESRNDKWESRRDKDALHTVALIEKSSHRETLNTSSSYKFPCRLSRWTIMYLSQYDTPLISKRLLAAVLVSRNQLLNHTPKRRPRSPYASIW